MNAVLSSAEKLLAQMSRAEKAQIVTWAANDLGSAWPGIESLPGICDGAACIARTRVPVWVLETLRRQGMEESVILGSYPTLTAQDLANAWGYVRANLPEIEQAIADNEAD